MEGEQLVSDALDRLNILHEHHNFSSLKEYRKTQGKGPDLWYRGLYQFEVKNFPNSELSSPSHFDTLVDSRFSGDVEIKVVIQIQGKITDKFIHYANSKNVKVIYVENPSYLYSKLEYWMSKLGLIPKVSIQASNGSSVYIPKTSDTYGIILDGVKQSIRESSGGKGPPPTTQSPPKSDPSPSSGYRLMHDGGVQSTLDGKLLESGKQERPNVVGWVAWSGGRNSLTLKIKDGPEFYHIFDNPAFLKDIVFSIPAELDYFGGVFKIKNNKGWEAVGEAATLEGRRTTSINFYDGRKFEIYDLNKLLDNSRRYLPLFQIKR